MPSTIEEKTAEYVGMGLSPMEIDSLVSERKLCNLFDAVVKSGCKPSDAASWIINDCAGILRKSGKTVSELDIMPEDLSYIITAVDTGRINHSVGKKVLGLAIEKGVVPEQYVAEHGFDTKLDTSLILETVYKVISVNQKAVNDFMEGKTKALQALIGGCMKELKGKGDPATIKELLIQELKKG